MPNSEEKQVEQLLINANQALNFLRTVIDDLLLTKDKLSHNSLIRLIETQEKYKKHKAVLVNIENLLGEQQYSISSRLNKSLAENLRKRISIIIEKAIELDKER